MMHYLKIIQKSTGKIIGEVTTNHGMTDDEVYELAGIEYMKTQEDFDRDEGYDFHDLEVIWE